MLQKFTASGFKWVPNTSWFSKDFIENNNEDSDEGYFFEVDVQQPEALHNLHNDLSYLLERLKIVDVKKLVVNLHNIYLNLKNLK